MTLRVYKSLPHTLYNHYLNIPFMNDSTKTNHQHCNLIYAQQENELPIMERKKLY